MPTEDAPTQILKAFSDPNGIAQYADGVRRFVPGLTDLHRMTGLLLAERAPKDARVLNFHPNPAAVAPDPDREGALAVRHSFSSTVIFVADVATSKPRAASVLCHRGV